MKLYNVLLPVKLPIKLITIDINLILTGNNTMLICSIIVETRVYLMAANK